jgi:hypothetical protein
VRVSPVVLRNGAFDDGKNRLIKGRWAMVRHGGERTSEKHKKQMRFVLRSTFAA